MSQQILADRYRLDERLGRGGMATVWQAHDLRLKRDVAVKIMDLVQLDDPTAVERFRREIHATAQLVHPNIVSVFDAGTDRKGRQYLVVELLQGQTVQALIDAGPLPIDQAEDIVTQVCAGLAVAHAAGIVHRDIKPANIMVTPEGLVKLLDFGVARLYSGSQSTLTQTGVVLGSSHYLAPEQVLGTEVDGRADLYALGCVLYAMLTGGPPFRGLLGSAVIAQHVRRMPEPPRRQRSEIPRSLDRLVMQLLAKDPSERPSSAEEVAKRLSKSHRGFFALAFLALMALLGIRPSRAYYRRHGRPFRSGAMPPR